MLAHRPQGSFEGTLAIATHLSPVPSPLQALDGVQADLDALSACCDSMGASLAGSRAAAADLLHDTQRLQRALQVSAAAPELWDPLVQSSSCRQWR